MSIDDSTGGVPAVAAVDDCCTRVLAGPEPALFSAGAGLSRPGTGSGPRFDAVLLAGAASERLSGADKPMLYVGDQTLLARAICAVEYADRVVVVGPPRIGGAEVVWCQEEPAGSGPVAAVAAGARRTRAACVVVLACDLPFVAAAVPVLLAALSASLEADVAVLVDSAGRRNYLAGAWRRAGLVARLAEMGSVAGRSMRSLFAGLTVLDVRDEQNWGTDCDTWDAVEHARYLAASDAAGGPHPG
jgi:molybdopterin-guanine dinucleotide biosynthesis protein A